MSKTDEPQHPTHGEPEPEHQGSIWTHPYMVYVVLTMVIFLFLVVLGALALKNGWLPNRGIST